MNMVVSGRLIRGIIFPLCLFVMRAGGYLSAPALGRSTRRCQEYNQRKVHLSRFFFVIRGEGIGNRGSTAATAAAISRERAERAESARASEPRRKRRAAKNQKKNQSRGGKRTFGLPACVAGAAPNFCSIARLLPNVDAAAAFTFVLPTSGMPAIDLSAGILSACACAKEKTLVVTQYTNTPCGGMTR